MTEKFFDELKPGDDFFSEKRSEYCDDSGWFTKIEYHEYDLGYYQLNALNIDKYTLDYFEDHDIVKIRDKTDD